MRSGIKGFIWAEFFAHAKHLLEILRYCKGLNEAVLNAIEKGQIER